MFAVWAVGRKCCASWVSLTCNNVFYWQCVAKSDFFSFFCQKIQTVTNCTLTVVHSMTGHLVVAYRFLTTLVAFCQIKMNCKLLWANRQAVSSSIVMLPLPRWGAESLCRSLQYIRKSFSLVMLRKYRYKGAVLCRNAFLLLCTVYVVSSYYLFFPCFHLFIHNTKHAYLPA